MTGDVSREMDAQAAMIYAKRAAEADAMKYDGARSQERRAEKNRKAVRPLIWCMVLSFALYAFLHVLLAFEVHRRLEFGLWLTVFILGLALFIYYLSCYLQLRYGMLRSQRWHAIYCLVLGVAFAGGLWDGDQTYFMYMQPYYILTDLASYINVNPKLERGQSYMDAGTIYFREGVRVSVEDAR